VGGVTASATRWKSLPRGKSIERKKKVHPCHSAGKEGEGRNKRGGQEKNSLAKDTRTGELVERGASKRPGTWIGGGKGKKEAA